MDVDFFNLFAREGVSTWSRTFSCFTNRMFGKEVLSVARPVHKKVLSRVLKQFKDLVEVGE